MSGTLRLRGATSGYSELQAPAVAADQTFVLPTAGGTLLTTDSPVPKLTLELGSASQPSLTFEGDTDTGLYSSGTNTLNLVTGGSDRLVIDSSGNVGIGTTSPSTLMHLKGTADTYLTLQAGTTDGNDGILFKNSAGTQKGVILFDTDNDYMFFSTNNTERMRIDSSGNAGIGATAPALKLHVEDSSSQIIRWARTGVGAGSLDVDANGNAVLNAHTTSTGIAFHLQASEKARIDSSGRLLVGTTSSSQVNTAVFQGNSSGGSAPGVIVASNINNPSSTQVLGKLAFSDNGHVDAASIKAARDGGTWTSGSSQPSSLALFTTADGVSSPTERMRIDSSGNVGVGTSSPVVKLDVNGGINLASGYDLTWGGAYAAGIPTIIGTLGGGSPYIAFRPNGSTAEAVRILDSGNVGIGTTSPVRNLQLGNNTSASEIISLQTTTTGKGSIYFGDNSATSSEYAGMLRYDHADNSMQFRTSSTERMRIDSSGRVGIGTSSPSASLGAGGLHVTDRIAVGSGSNGTPALHYDGDTDTGFTFATARIGFVTGASERMRIDSSGRLLVGTSTARSNFFNTGTISALFQTEGAAAAGDPAGRFVSQVYGRNNNDGPIHILAKHRGTSVGGTTVVANGDQFGILSFQGSDGTQFVEGAYIAAYADSTPGANDMPGRLVFSTTADGTSSAAERMRITNAGDVRIGTTAAGAGAGFTTKIAVSGGDTSMFKTAGVGATSAAPLRAWHDATSGNNLLQLFHTDTALNTRGTITYNRSSNLLQYNTTSDARLKTNITDASSALSDLSQVRVRSFDWIEDGHNKVNYGFVAQELNDIAPYAVSEGDHEDEVSIQWGVSNSSMVPLLTKALQEAIAKIETLEQRLSDAGIA